MREELVSPRRAAELLGVSDNSDGGMRFLRELRSKRRIPYHRLGRRTLAYPTAGLLEYLEKTRINAR